MKRSTIWLALTVVACALDPIDAGANGPSRSINTYVLFAYDELVFKGGSIATDSGHIHGGNIGVNFPGHASDGYSMKYATTGRAIMDVGYEAVADSVRADNPAGVFYDLYANSVSPSFDPTILGMGPLRFATPIIPSADLPVLPFTPNRTLTNNALDVTVGGVGLPSPFTFVPGVPYRDVRVNNNATVNFPRGVFDMRSLSLGSNVTVNVTDSTELRIDRGFSTNDGLKFGRGTQAGAHVFVGAYGFNPNATQVTNFSHHAEIHVQYFAPTGWLDLGGDNDLYGRFWAQRISGDPDDDINYDGPPPLKSFDCFEIHRTYLNRSVSLADDFGSSTVTVKKAKRICAPASKNGDDPSAVDDPAHLTFYTMKQTHPRFAKARGVIITNEFGTSRVDVLKPSALLVPTAKSLTSTPAPLGSPIDHFKCYYLTGTKFKAGPFSMEDQFGTTQLNIVRPLYLCLPADKNGEGIIDPASSLMCYQVTGAPPASRPSVVYTENQFGPDSFDFFGPRAFCVPSTATLP